MASDVGERIRALRFARDLPQSGLATAVSVSKSYLSHIEAGRRPVSADLLRRIAAVLDVDVTQLEEGPPADAKEELGVRLRFAELALRNGDWELAGREFADALTTARDKSLRSLEDEAVWGLARSEEANGHLEEAIRRYEWLLEQPHVSAAIPMTSVSVALIRAYSECADLNRAIDIGERAVAGWDASEAQPDVVARVELLSTLAGCYLERGDLMRAKMLIDHAVRCAEEDGAARARAAAAWNSAVIANARHDAAAARLHADRALALYAEIDNARAVGLLRVVSAGLRLRDAVPDPGQALGELSRAVQGLRDVGTRLDIGYAHTEEARAWLLSGDPRRALAVGRDALADLSDGDRLQRGRTLIVVGQASSALGRDQEAIDAYREAALVLEHAGASRQAGTAWRELAEAYVELDRTAEAIDALRRASDLAGAVYNPMRPVLDAAAR